MIENSSTLSPAPTVFPLAKGRVWLLFGGSLLFVVGGAVLLDLHQTIKMILGGAAGVLFFGYCAVRYAQRLIQGRPELLLDAAGLDHVQLGRIAWTEIAAVRIRQQQVRSSTQLFIELVLHDPAAYLARAPRMVRGTASMNSRLGFGPANIPVTTLPVPPEAVLEAMRRHHPDLTVL